MRNIHLHRECYSHNAKIGVLVEFSLETDFAARTGEFLEFARNIAMHIAASNPQNVAELLKQAFIRDPATRVETILGLLADKLSERITITRFVRWADEPPPQEPVPPDRPAMAMRVSGENVA